MQNSPIALLALTLLFIVPCLMSQSPQAPAPPAPSQPHGSVVFSRSTDENGDTTTTAGPAAQIPGGTPVPAPTATDSDRLAITFTAYDLDVHLHLEDHHIAVRAIVTVRNTSDAPLARVPLQISSSLNWETIRVAGRETSFTVATLNSDVDHTGQLHEAAVPLAAPLAPGAAIQLDVTYSGAITANAQRLLAVGTPTDVALHSDWDTIGPDFTGLRGFGNVVWYPASAVPVILGDGARVFDEMGEHKLHMAGAQFRLRLAAEFPHGQAPTVALINGQAVPLTITDAPTEGAEVAGVATAGVDNSSVGFEAPSIFLAIRSIRHATNTTLFTLPADDAAVEDWSASIAAVTPFLQGWLGERSRSELSILDLPDPEDAPFETGSLLAIPIHQATPEKLDSVLAHALTHAWVCTSKASPPAWLNEGLSNFMGTLWIEKSTPTDGRQKALESLEAERPALALAEPSSPGQSAGQPLAQAISPIYYRTKAAYVFWMLRDLVGDPALSAALRAYSPSDDSASGLDPNLGPGTFQKLIEQAAGTPAESSSSVGSVAGPHGGLSSFFSDWVNADKGLPDLAIDTVFSSHTQGDNWLVAISLSNSGYAAAEVPVTVRNDTTSITQRVLVPAHGKATQRILIQGRPTQVQVNDGTVPETQASVHIRDLTAADTPDAPASDAPSRAPQ